MLLVWTCLALGALARRLGALPASAPGALNRFVVVVALPALVLLHARDIPLTRAGAAPALAPWLTLAVGVAIVEAIGRARGWSRRTVGALALTAGLSNTSFVGFALIDALLGPAAMPTALVLDQLGSFLAVSTAGVALAAAYAGGSVSPGALARRVMAFPPFLALAAGLLTRGWPLPAAVVPVLGRLGETMVPLAIFSLGLQLDVSPGALRRSAGPLAVGLGYKLALAPALAWLALSALGAADGLPARVIVLETAMAPMVTAGILAADHDLEPELAARMVGVGLLVSLVTVPAISALLA